MLLLFQSSGAVCNHFSIFLSLVTFSSFMFHISVPIIHYSCHITETEGEVGIPWGRFKPPSILILTVPGRYFCCGSLLLLVLAVRIYTLVQLLC